MDFWITTGYVLFVQQLAQFNINENAQFPHYWSFMGGTHRYPMNALTNGQ